MEEDNSLSPVTISELHAEVMKLEREHQRCKQMLHSRTIHSWISKSDERVAAKSTKSTATNKDNIHENVKRNTKRAKLVELQRAYRLTGCTLFALDENRVCVRFDTCFHGEYFEQYFAVLKNCPHARSKSTISHVPTLKEQKKPSLTKTKHRSNPNIGENGDIFQLVHHTLPSFLPIQKLVAYAEEYTLNPFLEYTSLLLQAFVARRQRIQSIEEQVVDKRIDVHPSCCYAKFKIHSGEQIYSVELSCGLEDQRFSSVHISDIAGKKIGWKKIKDHVDLTINNLIQME
eukprot:m.47945 g.47945  ORF g.47945 m.47945 type:complete len:288 (-) comp7368_c1_seq1:845-1708(-)